MHGGPTPLRVSTYTSYLLYKAQDPFSTGRQPIGGHFFFLSILKKDQPSIHRPRNSRREYAWWTNSLGDRFLHRLPVLQSSRSIQHIHRVPCPKQFFVFSFYTGLASASQTKKLRKRMYMVDLLPCGSVHTPAISCTKLKIHSAHTYSPMAETTKITELKSVEAPM